jgi:hypothetical protein
MTDRDETGRKDESAAGSVAADDGNGELLPAADPGTTDAEKYSTDEGRTEEDLEP